MNNNLNVLVTAVGSEVGQGVIKALKSSNYDFKIIGCDIDPDSAGFFMCDNYYVVSKASSKKYLDEMIEICQEEKIDILFPNADLELKIMSEFSGLFEDNGVNVVIQPLNVLDIFQSKYKTYKFLKTKDLVVPETVKLIKKDNYKSISNLEFPIIVKPDYGQGSKSLFLIKDSNEFNIYSKIFEENEYVAQQYIPSEDEEYTCAIFNCDLIDEPYFIIFKRKLKNGTTGVAEIIFDDSLMSYFKKISDAIDLKGSINIQFRKFKGKPYIFEINPRFSSTTGIRACCGFNDVKMAIDYFVFKKPPKKPKITKKKIIRYLEEIYIDV